jgi:hypothetical protein
MAINWEKLGRRANAAITSAEAKEAAALAKVTGRKDDARQAEILRRSAKVLRGK